MVVGQMDELPMEEVPKARHWEVVHLDGQSQSVAAEHQRHRWEEVRLEQRLQEIEQRRNWQQPERRRDG